MTPSHHPQTERLIEYAAGAMDPGSRLVIDSHLRACPRCRADAAVADAVGGALLQAIEPQPLQADALARAMARIEAPPPPARSAPPGPAGWIEVPAEIARAAQGRRWTAPRVWVAKVAGRPSGPRSYLLRVGAGMSVPRHTHRGAEMICVLKGAFRDRGETYASGDFVENDETVEHRPTVTREGECVCLVATVGSLIARDWVGRLFQPFVGI